MVDVKRLVDGKLSVCLDNREIAILSAEFSRRAEYELRRALIALKNALASEWMDAFHEDDEFTAVPV